MDIVVEIQGDGCRSTSSVERTGEESNNVSKERRDRSRSIEKYRSRFRSYNRNEQAELHSTEFKSQDNENNPPSNVSQGNEDCGGYDLEETQEVIIIDQEEPKNVEINKEQAMSRSRNKCQDRATENSRGRSREKSRSCSRGKSSGDTGGIIRLKQENITVQIEITGRSRSRGHSRERSRGRSRGRSRESIRRRSCGRSRGRPRCRSRGRSRDRSRGRSRDRSKGKSRDRSRGRSRGRSREHSRGRSRGHSRDRSPRKSC